MSAKYRFALPVADYEFEKTYILHLDICRRILFNLFINFIYSLEDQKKIEGENCQHSLKLTSPIVGDGKIFRKLPLTSRVVCEGSAGSIALVYLSIGWYSD